MDLVLRGGRVVDPRRNFDRVCDVAIRDGVIAAIGSQLTGEREISVSGLMITPGLIDLHTHCFHHHDIEGLDPDAIGVRAGVTSVVDMGSSGPYTFEAFKRWIVERAHTDVYAFVSAQSMGGYVQGHRVPNLVSPEMIDEEAAIAVIAAHPQLIRGIKVQGNAPAYSRWQTKLLETVKRIGRATKVPAYLHIGQTEGVYSIDPKAQLGSVDDVLPRMLEHLDPGDVLGHVFYFSGSITDSNGRLLPGVRAAVDRGVRLDVAHGWHFSLDMARRVLEQGITPFVISSDQHRDYQIPGRHTRSNAGLALVMSKLLALGVPLLDVIAMATSHPAEVLMRPIGTLAVGDVANVSVLAIQDGKWRYDDAFGGVVEGKQRIVPVLAVRAGRIFEVNPVLLPDLTAIQDCDPIPGRRGNLGL